MTAASSVVVQTSVGEFALPIVFVLQAPIGRILALVNRGHRASAVGVVKPSIQNQPNLIKSNKTAHRYT
jgi:hypothetical protein